MDFSLPKQDIIRSKRDIDALFESGRTISRYPLKAWYRAGNGCGTSRMMVSVPKRCFKRAVKRNLLKRRVREAFRLNRHMLGSAEYDIFFVYLSKEPADYDTIQSRVCEIFRHILSQAEKGGESAADTAGEVLSDMHIPV